MVLTLQFDLKKNNLLACVAAITSLPNNTDEALLVTDLEKYVFSPFYPSQYFRGLKLGWTLKAPPFTVITLKVRSYNFYLLNYK